MLAFSAGNPGNGGRNREGQERGIWRTVARRLRASARRRACQPPPAPRSPLRIRSDAAHLPASCTTRAWPPWPACYGQVPSPGSAHPCRYREQRSHERRDRLGKGLQRFDGRRALMRVLGSQIRQQRPYARLITDAHQCRHHRFPHVRGFLGFERNGKPRERPRRRRPARGRRSIGPPHPGC